MIGADSFPKNHPPLLLCKSLPLSSFRLSFSSPSSSPSSSPFPSSSAAHLLKLVIRTKSHYTILLPAARVCRNHRLRGLIAIVVIVFINNVAVVVIVIVSAVVVLIIVLIELLRLLIASPALLLPMTSL